MMITIEADNEILYYECYCFDHLQLTGTFIYLLYKYKTISSICGSIFSII